MSLKGSADEITRRRVRGWLFDPESPHKTQLVSIRVNDREIGRCTANRHREGLTKITGSGDHEYCFDFDPPLSVFEQVAIELVIAETGEPIAGGRKILKAPRLTRNVGGPTPILVTSTGRAGTTLLMNEFRQRPEILVAGEYPFEIKLISYYAGAFGALVGNEDRVNSTNPDNLFAAENRNFIGHNPYNAPGYQRFAQNPGVLEEFFEETIPNKLAALFRDLILEYYALVQADAEKGTARFFAEKGVLNEMPRLAARSFFSTVLEVVLVRDPRDLMCSAKSFWGYSGSEALKMLSEALPQLETMHEATAPDTFFLRYEDLIEHPTASRCALYRFIGIEPDGEAPDLTDPALFKVHATSRDAAASIGRWEHDLSGDEIAACERASASFMQRFGYASSQQGSRGDLPMATQSIEFSRTGNSLSYCTTGWSAPEEGWRWATGSEARMVLPRPVLQGDYILKFKLRPFLAKPDLARQRITIEVNGASLVSFEEDRAEPTVKSFIIPSDIVANGAILSIAFQTPDATQPSQFGYPDTRKLSFAFQTLTLTPLAKNREQACIDDTGEGKISALAAIDTA